MKSLGELQVSLNLAAKVNRNRKFYSLRDKVSRMDVLWEAWRKVRANHGAAGTDRQTIEDIEGQRVEQFLLQLQKELLDGTYKVQCVRRVYIPKPKGKKERPLGIPTVRDRVVQQAVKLIIEPIFEADFQPFSFGYRPDKSAKDASSEVYKYLNYGLTNVVEVDIKGFFDHINHSKLLSFVMERIADGYIIRLIRKWLRAGVVYMDSVSYPLEGTPQGGVISPLFANVFLNKLDTMWTALGMNRRDAHNAQLVRYADDMVILTDRKYASNILGLLEQLLVGLDLELSTEKSGVVKLNGKNGFDFLGFRFTRRYDGRKGKDVTRFFPSQEAKSNYRRKLCEIASTRYCSVKSERQLVDEANRLILGWSSYFNHSNANGAYQRLQLFTERRLIYFMRRKHRPKFLSIDTCSKALNGRLGLSKLFGRISYTRSLL